MAILRPDKSFQNLKRYHQIATVLIKYGFGEIVSRMNLGLQFMPSKNKKDSESVSRYTSAERVRMALEELGPTYVKMGQVLSTRPFLIPAEYIIELSKLQDQVEPMPWTVASLVLSRELKKPISECFSYINEEPLASASLSQVHEATLIDGTQVVVKIQRQGIKKIIDSDMVILYDIAELLERNVDESKQFDPTGLVEELAKSTQKEINFLNEARNAEIFAANFAKESGIKIPKVYRKFTTEKILTLERIQGTKISNIEELKSKNYDTGIICKNGARLVLKMIFEDGFFHADPHPGNLFVCEGNIIAPVDFGMMGTLSQWQMDFLGDMIIAVMSKDTNDMLRVLQNADIIPPETNIREIEQDLSELIVKYYKMSLKQIDMKMAIDDFFTFAQAHQIKFQSEFMLLGKALLTYEEVARLLHPEFNFFAAIGPYLKKIAGRKYNKSKLVKDFIRAMDELRWFFIDSPREWRRIADKLSHGELKVKMQHEGLNSLIRELDRSSNRISISLLIAALIVGSSLIMTIKQGIMIFDVPLLGLIGYLFAAVLGVFLVLSILRSGKL